MEKEDEWSPETKLWPFVAPLCIQITAGKLSVKSQFIPTKSRPLNGTEWHQLSTRGVHWVSSPFLIKS